LPTWTCSATVGRPRELGGHPLPRRRPHVHGRAEFLAGVEPRACPLHGPGRHRRDGRTRP
jgi:hypothetical protein